jgi:hypothetical protein
MSAKSEEFHRKAAEAEVSATTARDLSAREMYARVSEHYRFLARQQEYLDSWTTQPKA